MTSNGRRESSALRGPTVWVWRLISPSVRRPDFLAFGEAVAAVVAERTPTLLAEDGAVQGLRRRVAPSRRVRLSRQRTQLRLVDRDKCAPIR
jgi:hypothetical protein